MSPRYLQLLSSLFITALIASNITAAKIAAFGGLFLPAAVIIFPFTYVLSDIITEVYGFHAMRRTIWIGFLCNLIAVGMFWIAMRLPAAPFYTGQDAFMATLGSTSRILIASFIAYLCGEFLNSTVLAKMKVRMQGRLLWLRIIISTILGEGVDSFLFITIVFSGIFPPEQVLTLALTQWIFKVCVEMIVLPLTSYVVRVIKRQEKIDHYDTDTRFRFLPF